MEPQPPHVPGRTLPQRAIDPSADPRVIRVFFGSGVAICVALALTVLLLPGALSAQERQAVVWLTGFQALVFAAGAGLALRNRVPLAVVLTCCSALAVTAAASLQLSPEKAPRALAFMGLYALLCAVFAGRRAGIAMGVAAIVAVLAQHLLRGDSTPVSLALNLLLVGAGLLVGLSATVALERSIHAVREREQRFHALLGIAADWYWEQDAQLRFTRISDSVVDDTGVAAHEHLGRTRWEIPEFALGAEQWAAHRADLDARRPFRNLVMRRPDMGGRPRYISVSGEPVFSDRGEFQGYWGVGRVVTDEVLAQRVLQASEERYRELFARSPTPMIAHRNGYVVDANAAAAEMLGYPGPTEMVGVYLAIHYADEAQRGKLFERIAHVETLPIGERLPLTDFRLERTDQRRLDVQATGLRVRLDDGPATLSIYLDLTARKATEQALRHSQTLLSQLFDTTPDVVTLAEYATGRYLMINDRFTQLLGWTRAEAIGRSTLELDLYKEVGARDELRTQLRERGSLRDALIVFRSKAGELVPLRVSAALLTFDAIDYVVVVARDVSATEQSRLEREAILNNASIGIGFTREDRFVLANPHFEMICGWPTGSLAGQSGSVVWASAEEYAEIGRIAGPLLAAGQPFEAERPMRRRDGTMFWCRLRARAVDPSDTSRGGTIWIAEDITERRQVEQSLAAARDAAESANRAKSAFLANTSHEIRTPLNGLLGLARLAQQPEVDAELRERYLAQIFDSAQALSGIIADILDLSKIEAGKLSLETVPFDLRALLDSLCDSYAALAEARGLQLERRFDPALPEHVRGDPVRVRQIVGNYLSNALKFTARGSVCVEVTRGPGELLHFVVGDTGPGIDATTQARLFRPFVQADDSTTRRYGGTGLGLSICLELATLMGGAVGVDSKPRRGSRFWADLPLSAVGQPEAHEIEASGFGALVSGAHVLVVEDNAVNLLIVRAMLEGWGMQVAEAGDGQQALDAVERAGKAGRPFDAVLMDVQMPVMSGHDAARRLRERPSSAGLPIVALTAAALVSERDQALAAGMDAFLTKPVDPAQLRQTLARVIAARARV